MKTLIISTFLLFIAGTFLTSAQNTTRKSLVSNISDSEIETIYAVENISADTANITATNVSFSPTKFKIRGFEKKLSDSKESFFIINESATDISRIKIRLQYRDLDNNLLHERIETIDCEIPSGETRQTYIPAFDRQRRFYYYRSTKPRRQSTPFKVSYQILRYDVIAQ